MLMFTFDRSSSSSCRLVSLHIEVSGPSEEKDAEISFGSVFLPQLRSLRIKAVCFVRGIGSISLAADVMNSPSDQTLALSQESLVLHSSLEQEGIYRWMYYIISFPWLQVLQNYLSMNDKCHSTLCAAAAALNVLMDILLLAFSCVLLLSGTGEGLQTLPKLVKLKLEGWGQSLMLKSSSLKFLSAKHYSFHGQSIFNSPEDLPMLEVVDLSYWSGYLSISSFGGDLHSYESHHGTVSFKVFLSGDLLVKFINVPEPSFL